MSSAIQAALMGAGLCVTMLTAAAAEMLPPALDLLRDAAGRPIVSAEGWEKRRPEILAKILREAYGFVPSPPESISFIGHPDSVCSASPPPTP